MAGTADRVGEIVDGFLQSMRAGGEEKIQTAGEISEENQHQREHEASEESAGPDGEAYEDEYDDWYDASKGYTKSQK